MKGKRFSRRPMSDINIVPYVDVMLVLLVIFMVTAPMITQGVHVDLPQTKAEILAQDEKPPVIVTVDARGSFFLDQAKEAIAPQDLATKVQTLLRVEPTRAVLVRGDKQVSYGHVMEAMVLLKQAGVSKVGLMTQPIDELSP